MCIKNHVCTIRRQTSSETEGSNERPTFRNVGEEEHGLWRRLQFLQDLPVAGCFHFDAGILRIKMTGNEL